MPKQINGGVRINKQDNVIPDFSSNPSVASITVGADTGISATIKAEMNSIKYIVFILFHFPEIKPPEKYPVANPPNVVAKTAVHT